MPLPQSCLIQQASNGSTIYSAAQAKNIKAIFDSFLQTPLSHLPVCQFCLLKYAWNSVIYDHLYLDLHVSPYSHLPWSAALALVPQLLLQFAEQLGRSFYSVSFLHGIL